MLLAVCVLSALCTLPVMGQKKATPASQKYQPKAISLDRDINAIKPDFMRAVYNGDVATVKKILEKNMLYSTVLLRTKMYNGIGVDGENLATYPICIATQKGYNEMIKYMVKKDPTLTEVICVQDTFMTPIRVAIRLYHRADTTILLHDLAGRKMFSFEDLMAFSDRGQLQKLIPALLDRGVNFNEIDNFRHVCAGDAFVEAARYDNVNFIIVLRDEMKKRGKKPVAVMGGERSDSMIKLLKQYGIKIDDQCRE